ncbi:hypothetical protein BJY52DRAFT_1263499 [Lactarius psammicola]|nr:hypothetical protein BJY52DRAFT_1263499 [Lactarius psammicola]
MSTTLPFPCSRFLPSARYKSCLPPVLTGSDVQLLASPVIQVVSQPRDLESLSSIVTTPSPPPSVTDGLKGRRRRSDPNHVPRPLNSFFLFKADWLAKRKSLLAGIEQDNRQLNRMASSEWRKLPQEVKQRFKDAAHRAKVEHATKYPEYRFTPKPRGDRRRRKTRRNEPEVLLRNEEAARLVSQGITGDALLKALADHDRRATQRPISGAASPHLFSEAPPCTASASSSVHPPPPSVDVYSSPDLVVQPISALVDLGTIPDTLAGGSYLRQVAPPPHAPVVDDIQAILAEPGRDPYSLHFDYFLPGDSTIPILQPCGLSNQLLQSDHRVGQENDWNYHTASPVGEAQEQSLCWRAPLSEGVPAWSRLRTRTYRRIPPGIVGILQASQQDLFSSNDSTSCLNFTFLCTSGTTGDASSGDLQSLFLPTMESTYHWPAFPSYPALFNLGATDGLDLDPTITAD